MLHTIALRTIILSAQNFTVTYSLSAVSREEVLLVEGGKVKLLLVFFLLMYMYTLGGTMIKSFSLLTWQWKNSCYTNTGKHAHAHTHTQTQPRILSSFEQTEHLMHTS